MNNRTPLSIWALSDGRIGMENQAVGLSEAIARRVPATITTKRIKISRPFDALPRVLWGAPLRRLSPTGDMLAPPWPDIWIACGRRTVPLSMAVHGKGPFVIQTQHPRAPLEKFDLVIPPRHDLVTGTNVLPMTGSPNRLNDEKISNDAERLLPYLPPLPRPFVSVLLGGTSKDYRLTEEKLSSIIDTINTRIDQGFGILITPSRRTGEAALARLKAAFPPEKVWIWDGAPLGSVHNPYFGLLGLADHILCTEESANMLTDAAFTGKPVTLLRLDGGAPKWERFHKDLSQQGVFGGNAYAPLRETDRIAEEILKRYYHQHAP